MKDSEIRIFRKRGAPVGVFKAPPELFLRHKFNGTEAEQRHMEPFSYDHKFQAATDVQGGIIDIGSLETMYDEDQVFFRDAQTVGDMRKGIARQPESVRQDLSQLLDLRLIHVRNTFILNHIPAGDENVRAREHLAAYSYAHAIETGYEGFPRQVFDYMIDKKVVGRQTMHAIANRAEHRASAKAHS